MTYSGMPEACGETQGEVSFHSVFAIVARTASRVRTVLHETEESDKPFGHLLVRFVRLVKEQVVLRQHHYSGRRLLDGGRLDDAVSVCQELASALHQVCFSFSFRI